MLIPEVLIRDCWVWFRTGSVRYVFNFKFGEQHFYNNYVYLKEIAHRAKDLAVPSLKSLTDFDI